MAKRKKVRNSWAASVLREVADRLATVDDCGSSSACVRRAHKAADRLTAKSSGRRTPRVMRLPAIGLAVALALSGGAAHAALGGAEVCGDLRAQRPDIRAPLAVICHFPADGPNGQTVVSSSYFGCPPLDDGHRHSRPVEVEAYDEGCASPFGDAGE
jgi:hypothetical protein